MRRFLPDTVFGRLFGLVILAVIASHVVVIVLFLSLKTAPPDLPPRPMPDASSAGPELHRQAPPRRPPPPLPDLFVGLLVQFAAVSVAAWFGARMLARPIQQLAIAAERLGGNLNSPPMDEQGPREARRASRVFNQMQSSIRAQLEERERFLAAVSHDLRTPLTRMKLRIESIPESAASARLRDDVSEMATMLDATLSYLRGEAHDEPWQRVDVQSLVESVAEDACESGGSVEVSGSAQPVDALPHALRRCLDNLVENATRYGGNTCIRLLDSPANLVIEVQDDGPGIPENRLAQVMEPFVRLEDSRNRDSGGVGLGLSIALDAVRRHGGELRLRNAPEGGLIARVTLPRH